jgi:GNAT superfamily N-acetyltransferase
MRLSDGYHELEPGRLAAVVTYLQQTERPAVVAAAPPPGMEIRRLEKAGLERYRALFRAVGEPWLWFSRLRMGDEELTATLNDPGVEVYVLSADGMDQGLLELDLRQAPDIEIAFLGVVPELVGRGAGRLLMNFAIESAWSRAPRRLWLHTCTLDHPGALGFYQHFGFRAYQRAIEVSPDPRLAGELPRAAAPHVPLVLPAGCDEA